MQGNRDTFPSQPQLRCVGRKQPITMSNAAVGHVYDTIIAEVVNAVRVDFEENGVDEGALEDLKKVRLSLFSIPLCPRHCSLGPRSAALTYHFPSSHLPINPSQVSFRDRLPAAFLSCTFFSSDRFPWFGVDGTSQSRDECRGAPSAAASGSPGGGREGVESSWPGWATQHFWVSF